MIFTLAGQSVADLKPVLYSATEYLHLAVLVSSAISYCCGMLTNYTLNKIFNFKNKSKKIMHQFGLFLVVALIGLALNQLIIFALNFNENSMI